MDRCALRPQSRAVWQAAPDSRCPRRGRGPGSRIGLGQIRDHTGADAEPHQHCRRAGRGCSDVVFESGHTGADEGPITLELMRNSISTADGQAGGALTWYSSRGTQGLVRARCRPVSPMQCKPASSFVQRDRAAPVPVLPRWLHRWLDTGAIPCWRCGATPLQPRPGPDGGPAAGLRAGGDRGAAARTRLLAPHWCCPFATKTLVRLGLRAEAHGPRREVNEGRGTKKATGVVGPAVEDCVYGRRTT